MLLGIKPSITGRFWKSRRARYIAPALIALLFLICLIGAALLDGISVDEMDWEFWRAGLQPPTIIIYTIAVIPLMDKLWNRAVGTLLPLVKGEDGTREKLAAEISKKDPWRESIAASLVMVLILVLSQPWNWDYGWVGLYRVVAPMIMFGLLGWLVYTGLRGARNLTRLTRATLSLDIFHLEVLAPVARWSLGISLAFIGGITISMVFVPRENLLNVFNISVYAVLICTTVLIFFISMLGTHHAILKVKKRELLTAQEMLTVAYRKMQGQVTRGSTADDGRVFSEVAAWGIYETSVRNIREWPYDASIIRRLVASLASPAAVYLIKLILGIQLG
jgi:MFS family permease